MYIKFYFLFTFLEHILAICVNILIYYQNLKRSSCALGRLSEYGPSFWKRNAPSTILITKKILKIINFVMNY